MEKMENELEKVKYFIELELDDGTAVRQFLKPIKVQTINGQICIEMESCEEVEKID